MTPDQEVPISSPGGGLQVIGLGCPRRPGLLGNPMGRRGAGDRLGVLPLPPPQAGLEEGMQLSDSLTPPVSGGETDVWALTGIPGSVGLPPAGLQYLGGVRGWGGGGGYVCG